MSPSDDIPPEVRAPSASITAERWRRFYAVPAEAVERALHAYVPGGAEVWHWLPQKPDGGPSDTAKEIIRAALAEALASPEPITKTAVAEHGEPTAPAQSTSQGK